ncbi:MAG: hypothetical protein M3T55_12375, partial [Pseudomonadota bacterium]|nr:hypothetical protein [Pseudomonadota bacterium]
LGAGDILANAGDIGGAVTMGAGTTLILTQATEVAGGIAGFAAGDVIDLAGVSATSASLNGDGRLVVANGAIAVATLRLSATPAGAIFTVASDGHGGSLVTVAAGDATGAAGSPAPSSHALIAAMAALASAAATPVATAHVEAWRPTLLGPRMCSA